MAWVSIGNFTLYPCDICVGQSDFQPYTPNILLYGLEPGQYKIEYVSGAVRSNNRQRFQKFLLSGYHRRWNKYYPFQQLSEQALKAYDYSFFPQLKLNVFQCQYGTLPGFTHNGTATKQLAQYYATNKNMITEIYEEISGQIAPLQFEIDRQSEISFWYTDDCAPCIQGFITYKISKNTESDIIPINGLSVISFNIYNLQSNISEYYKLNERLDSTLMTMPYKYQQNLLQSNIKKQHLLNLKQYNTIGYDNNKNSIFISYKNNYKSQILDDIFWKITKRNTNHSFNIITEVKAGSKIPLFTGCYTLILTAGYVREDSIIISYNNTDIKKQRDKQQYTFYLDDTYQVSIQKSGGYLYSGKVTINDLMEKYNIPDDYIERDLPITLLNSINYTYSEFYLYITQALIIIEKSMYFQNDPNLYGPFSTLQEAQKAVINYCIKNSLEYEQTSETEYAIG